LLKELLDHRLVLSLGSCYLSDLLFNLDFLLILARSLGTYVHIKGRLLLALLNDDRRRHLDLTL
jgi:hypothetical protein